MNKNKPLIAFDAKRAATNYTGLGNYSRYVLEGLTLGQPQISSLLCTPRKSTIKEYKDILSRDSVYEITPEPSKRPYNKAYWRSRGIIKALNIQRVDIFHGLSNEIPFGLQSTTIKTVVTIHDLIFLHFPQFYPIIDRIIYNYKFKYACQHSDRIIAISECTKRDIIKYYEIDEKKIDVIYQGCSKRFSEDIALTQLDEIRKKYDLPKKFLLSVGSIEERKNAHLIVQALPSINEEIPLILVGKRTAYTHAIEETARRLNVNHRVRIIDQLPFDDLPSVYRMATLFIYPSRYEGFGIPILEALCSKVPVIGATGSCLEEAGGPDSLYTNPDDPQELAGMINQVLSNPEQYSRMIQQGAEYVKRFNIAESTEQIMCVYRSLL